METSGGVPQSIVKLVETYIRNEAAYKSQGYNELQLRQEFINPFFEALGWDVYNKTGAAPAYRDVIHEDSIKMAGGTKAPDYCFTLSGRRIFFVETKKPAVDITKDTKPAYQLRRYAWSAGLPVSILMNFEQLAIYESRQKPKEKDKVTTERILLFSFKEFVEKWQEIAGIFSKQAVLQGSFDKFIEAAKQKRGTQEVGDEFLKEIEGWREELAKNIAIRNPELSVRELNNAVQNTIDRIIFLRMCEDRGIERYEQLKLLLNEPRIYEQLCKVFQKADEKYNSGLFHFKKEKDWASPPDELALSLKIDDKILEGIIKNLYYPESPYEFSVLRPEILGNVYEQFLGKVIRLTEGHHAKVEEKPEVKKAGGVFYTPQYIVEYIVKNTVGKLCDGKTPKQIEKIHILDPACGSGSFLLGAYTYLLNYHLDYYTGKKNPKQYKDQIYQRKDCQWFLTVKEKKRILLNNIFGVDIDSQAVEVTKLSLLLKVLEGEGRDVFEQQKKLFQERVLPDLANNIKCGNSLIGPIIYNTVQTSLFANGEMYRINAFDWTSEYRDIIENGGFDVVLGNPPYIRIQAMNEWAPVEVEFYKQNYKSASRGNYDIYVVFVEKGLELLNSNGLLGFILPHKFFNAKYGEALRKIISKGKNLSNIVYFGDQQVFAGSITYTCLLFLDKQSKSNFEFERVNNLPAWQLKSTSIKGKISLNEVTEKEWNFVVGNQASLFKKLKDIPIKLKDVSERIFQGLVTGADPVFILKNIDNTRYLSELLNQEKKLEKKLIHPLCKGSVDIRRYYTGNLKKSILFPYKIADGKAELLSVKELTSEYPLIWNYLLESRLTLESRERGKWKHEKWYAFGRSQNLNAMEQTKIITPSIAKSASFTLDREGMYYFVGSGGGGGGGYGITLKKDQQISYEYLLGLLNSKLLDMYLKSISSRFSSGYYAYNRQYIEQLPIRLINFSSKTDRESHEKMVTLVNLMLDFNHRLANAKTDNERMTIRRQIESTDKQIDQLVYTLYKLNDKEIELIEEVTKDEN